jgi:signal transduction histidine kinase
MKDASQEFADQYAAALEGYLAGAGEAALSSAYKLGRQALEYESGMLMMADAHHKALQTILLHKNLDGDENNHIIAKAADFFSECLSPFEMAQRGFQENITSLRRINDTLDRQQRDLTLLLSPMPNLLLTVDDRDLLAAFFVPPSFPNILQTCEVGLSLKNILPTEIDAAVIPALLQVRQSGQAYRLECPLTLSEKTLYFDLQITPVADSLDVLIVLNDITERKEIEIAEHNQRILAEALRDTAITLNSSLDLNQILNRIVASIGQVVPHDTANIMFIDRDMAHIVRSFGYIDYGLEKFEKSISKMQLSPEKTPTLYQVIQRKQAIVVPELDSYNKRYGHSGLGLSGSAVSAPILLGDLVIGLINLNSFKLNFFTSIHAENLQIFANQASVAIQNARLFEQAQELAAFNERQRLARDLHDSVSQSLFAASSIAESVVKQWERNPNKVSPLILDLHQLLKTIMAEMRILLWELRPANLVSTPLNKLLLQLVNSVQSRMNLTIHCTADETAQLPEDVHIAFYRIAQEALNNVVKHSRATEVQVHLYSKVKQVVLLVQDNGQGFNLTQTSSGFGLGNMRERASMIGAALDVTSESGQGTAITITWTIAALNEQTL